MDFLRKMVTPSKCDNTTVSAYFNGLSFGKQLDLLAKVANILQQPTSGAPVKGACSDDSVVTLFKSLSLDERLSLFTTIMQGLKKVPNNNNVGENYEEPTNEEVQTALNALERNMATAGGRRRKHKSRKASRRRLTRRRR